MSFVRRLVLSALLCAAFASPAAASCDAWLKEYKGLLDDADDLLLIIELSEEGDEAECRKAVDELRSISKKGVVIAERLRGCRNTASASGYSPNEAQRLLDSIGEEEAYCASLQAKAGTGRRGTQKEIKTVPIEPAGSTGFWREIGFVVGFALAVGVTFLYFSHRLKSPWQPGWIIPNPLTRLFRASPEEGGRARRIATRSVSLPEPPLATRAGAVRLFPRDGGRAIGLEPTLLAKRGVTIGRGSGCDVALADESVSRAHARLWRDERGVLQIEDLGSSNGTWKGNERIERGGLKPGDQIRFGAVVFTVEY